MASSSSSQGGSPFGEFEGETLTASSYSTKIFDAFINHRGLEVKGSVAFALCESLEENGYWTFLDENKVEFGGDPFTSTVQQAIYSSKLHISIFSPQYASSAWCLEELLLMLQTGARFISIFCDVDPSDLRYPEKGVYKAAFEFHERRGIFSKEKLDQWKGALVSCSRKSGYIFTTSGG